MKIEPYSLNASVSQEYKTYSQTLSTEKQVNGFSKRNLDVYIPSDGCPQLEEIDFEALIKKNMVDSWEKRKQEAGDDVFQLYSGSQHLVFAQKLQEWGVFDNMSEEEAEEVRSLLRDITGVMNSVNGSPSGLLDSITNSDSITYYYEGEFISEKRPDKISSKIYSFEARTELESSVVALRLFGEKYVSSEKREEFNSMVEDYYNYNSEYLNGYQAFGEQLELAAQRIRGTGALERWMKFGAPLFEVTEESDRLQGISTGTQTYQKAVSQLFQTMQKSGNDSSEIWKKLESTYLDFQVGKNNASYRDYLQDHSKAVWNHAQGYWSKLLASS